MTLMVTVLRLHYAKLKKKISLQPHKIIFAHTGKKKSARRCCVARLIHVHQLIKFITIFSLTTHRIKFTGIKQ